MDHMSMGDGDGDTCKISMLWNWTTIDACFLASSWHVKSKGMFAASCIGVVLLTATLEALRRLCREYDALIQRQWRAHAVAQSKTRNAAIADQQSDSSHSNIDADLYAFAGQQSITLRATFLQQTVRAVLHAVTFGVAYIVMLLAMYFNGYIIISIVIGSGLGKFFCDRIQVTLPLRITDNSRTCNPTQPVKENYLGGGALDEPTVCCG